MEEDNEGTDLEVFISCDALIDCIIPVNIVNLVCIVRHEKLTACPTGSLVSTCSCSVFVYLPKYQD